MRLPPRWLRRFVIWPLPLLLVWLYLAAVPLLVIAALVWSYKLPGKMRALRSLGLFSVYVFVEAALIISAFALWIASGFGWQLRSEWCRNAHYRLLRWALEVLVGAGERLFSLSIEVERAGGVDVGSTAEIDAPLIVMSRHAGPADSILLMQRLMTNGRRHPRIVLKADLQIDPAFDIMLNRLPNRFVRHGAGGSTTELVGALAADMGPQDAFVIFPEGGNFTEGRRQRAIDRFEERGETELAERARRLRHTLPPRPGGTLAALRSCPDAAVVVVAHTGLDHLEGVRDLWTAIPDHKTVRATWRAIPPEDVPADDEGRTEGLWRAWEAIDEWVAANATGPPAADR